MFNIFKRVRLLEQNERVLREHNHELQRLLTVARADANAAGQKSLNLLHRCHQAEYDVQRAGFAKDLPIKDIVAALEQAQLPAAAVIVKTLVKAHHDLKKTQVADAAECTANSATAKATKKDK